MAERKKCENCGKYDKFSKGLCKGCWQIKHGKPIRKISVKHQQTINEFKVIAKRFLEKRPYCEAKLKGCTYKATDPHHIAGKISKEQYLNEEDLLPVCRSCHTIIEQMGEDVYGLGFKIRRI